MRKSLKKIVKSNNTRIGDQKIVKKSSDSIIRVYTDNLLYSHFDFNYYKNLLEEKYKVKLCDTVKDANIIMSSYQKIIEKYLHLDKKFLIWTHEPYHDLNTESKIIIKGRKIGVINVYTGGIFINNYRYFYFNKPLEKLDDKNFPNFTDQEKTVVALSTFYPKSYYQKNKYQILSKRYEIINWGKRHKMLKVWGKGWDNSEGESRSVDRISNKNDILKKYHFNLAIENTVAPYYVTEKIWESIANYCLPIYYGGNYGGKNSTIYQSFPKDSFIDYNNFSNPEELFKYIKNMTITEYRDRMNLCIDVFNKSVNLCQNNLKATCEKNKNLEIVDYDQSFKSFLDFIINGFPFNRNSCGVP